MAKENRFTKTGRISKEAREYITKHPFDTNEQIAKAIRRTPETVEKYRKIIAKRKQDSDAKLGSTGLLEEKPYWRQLKDQFTNEELELFRYEWARFYVDQFNNDVMPAEELQLIELITTNILLNRNMVERKIQLEMLQSYSNDLKREMDFPVEVRDESWATRVHLLEANIANIRSTNKILTEERSKMVSAKNSFMDSLKATRQQRLDKTLERTMNWTNLLREIENEEFRVKEGRNAALLHMAAQKEKERLSQPTIFMDGSTDLPILSADTIGNFESLDKEEGEE